MGLWRSWERASMAWKRSRVRIPSGPPDFTRRQEITQAIPLWVRSAARQIPLYFFTVARRPKTNLVLDCGSWRTETACLHARLTSRFRATTAKEWIWEFGVWL